MYHARDLAATDVDELWQLPDGPMKVIFDDGVLETNSRATIYSAYMWGLYTLYPKTPALMAHHLGDKRVGSTTHLDLLGRVMWDCYDAYEADVPLAERRAFIESLSRYVYQATNRIYNDFTYRLESYVRTLSILDFIDVIHHPAIKAANDKVQPNQRSIDHTYTVIGQVLKDPRELIGNPVANAAKNGLVSLGQINQCVGPRGFVTDVDSNIFREPILTGFVQGLRSLYGSMIESRSAAKSLTFTEEPLQKTEYFNRRLQLLAATLKWVELGDCGSTTYLSWRVHNNKDLKAIAGKYYLTDKGLQRVKETDHFLVGELIQLRTVLHCLHPKADTICATCFGDLALSVPDFTNIGHVSATALCEQASQRVLSVKHEDKSSSVGAIELSEYDQQYIRIGSDPNTIKLSDRLENRRVLLTINAKEAEHISDVHYMEDVRERPTSMISNLTEVQLTIISKNREESVIVPVSMGARHSSMTHDLLEYAKKHGWTLTPTGNYCIDLSQWDNELPLFVLPLKHMNMLDYMATIETFLKASSEGGPLTTLKDFDTPEAALAEFFSLVSSELVVNIAHLEVLVKVAMIRSSRYRDYRIPHEGNAVEFGAFNTTMANRSLSAAMAYQDHKRVLDNPATFLITERPDHPLDYMLMG